MKSMKVIDITLRESSLMRESALTFKEKLEIARTLDRIRVDGIELPPIGTARADQLSNKTIASVVNRTLTATVDAVSDSVEETWESIRSAKHPQLNVLAPVSPVQMEYMCHKKAPAMLECISAQVKKCRFYCENVEFSALDATRAEADFLCQAIQTAIDAGANRVTICDSAGIMLADEFGAFVQEVKEKVPALKDVELYVQVSDELNMGIACAVAALFKGADGIKCTVSKGGYPTLEQVSRLVQVKGEALDITTNLRTTELNRAAAQLSRLLETTRSDQSPFDTGVNTEISNVTLSENDTIADVISVVRQLGYELSDDDNAKVYEAFRRVAVKKSFVGTRELDAIVASAAMQVPTTYRIDRYVINSGNIITATANITLERDGNKLRSVAIGDGPVDAAFLAIEQIIGHHYELDDFQIQTVTEGREAMGSALVKLRANGKLYSGNGISTDIIGASIRAYISALNKIVYEEESF
ncbi:MAG: hypothetical protein IKE58_09455 [Blautia sp.]|nr:hypothetical protein [Blautia sp.]